MKANEEWRNDPERREAAEIRLGDSIEALKELQALVSRAATICAARRGQKTPYAKWHTKLFSVLEDAGWYSRFYDSLTDRETYIGNMAAFGEGWPTGS